MKKYILHFYAIVITLSFFQFLSAQNTSPYWSIAGNNNATTISKLGTTNSIPLNFYTKNLMRMRLDTGGRFGINTAAPQALLDVNATSGFQVARFNDNQAKMYLGLFKNNKSLGYIGSYSGAASDVDFGTTTLNIAGKTHITTHALPRITVDTAGHVGIGTTSPSKFYKVDVEANTTEALFAYTTGGYGVDGESGYIGVYGYGPYYGVYGLSPSNATGVFGKGYYGIAGAGTYGVYGSGGSGSSYGVYGTSDANVGVWGQTVSGDGVVGEASNGIGGYFYSSAAYGIYAMTNNSSSWAGFFYGDVYATGSYQTSDKRLKKNIAEFSDAIIIINQLKPRTYEFKNDGKMATMNLPSGTHYGLIAQDLEQILPGMVKEVTLDHNPLTPPGQDQAPIAPVDPHSGTAIPGGQAQAQKAVAPAAHTRDNMTIKAVNYTELIPIMIEALQEQDKKIEAQNQINKDQQQQIDELKQAIMKMGGSVPSTTSGFSLGQGTPNPATVSTTISYTLPQSSNKGQLVITNNLGQVVKTIELTGSGTTSLDTSALASGVYNYSLLVDGKILDTKRLAVTK